jgi:hypothetical protein
MMVDNVNAYQQTCLLHSFLPFPLSAQGSIAGVFGETPQVSC